MKTEIAYFAGGCFWCTEAIFSRLNGVISVTVGYSGGNTENPSYTEVSTGDSGHAEVVRIVFNTDLISFVKLLEVFFSTHDPTTKNKQGFDVGSQYRSIILYTNNKQKSEAISYIKKLQNFKVYDQDIVTEVIPFSRFYEAEDYHKNYYQNNPGNLYCRVVIAPKMTKLESKFGGLLK